LYFHNFVNLPYKLLESCLKSAELVTEMAVTLETTW